MAIERKRMQQLHGDESDIIQLAHGEFAITDDTEKIFIGINNSNREIAKQDSLDDTNTTLTETIETYESIPIDSVDVLRKGIVTNVDETTNLQNLILSGLKFHFPYTTESFILNEVLVNSAKLLDGANAKINVTEQDKRAFRITSPTEFIKNLLIQNFNFTQANSSDPGGGTANNHATISHIGAINSRTLLNTFINISLGVTNQYANIGLADRKSKYNLVAFNYFENVEKMAIENIGSAYNRIVGNAIDGQGANSHGIRITGYGVDDINTKAEGHVAAANVINGMQNAISLQNTAKFNSLTAQSALSTSNNVIDVRPPTNADNTVSFNIVDGLTFSATAKAIYNDEGEYNVFEVVGREVTDSAITEVGGAQYGVNGHNHYKALIKDIAVDGAYIRLPYAKLDLDLIDVVGKGVIIGSTANFATGNIRVHGANTGVEIFASNCLLDVHVTNCTEASGRSIVVSGNNNVVRIYTDKNVQLGGSNNTLLGYVGGAITISSGAGTHSITGVKGYVSRGQEINKTTDTNGRFSVAHGLKTGTAVPTVAVFGTAQVTAKIRNLNATDIVFEFTNYDGTPYANQVVSFMWELSAI